MQNQLQKSGKEELKLQIYYHVLRLYPGYKFNKYEFQIIP